MKKVVNFHGHLVLERLPWMQDVKNANYNAMILVAITRGSIENAWENEIANYLKKMYLNPVNRPMIDELLAETGVANPMSDYAFQKAAIFITESQIPPSK